MNTSPITNARPRSCRPLRTRERRGLSAGWLLVWSPVFLLAVLLIVEVGNVFLAKVQLENALEAAALAGVKQWVDTDDTYIARVAAQQYAAANTVSGEPVMLDLNTNNTGPSQTPSPLPNGNLICDGEIVLGAVSLPDGVDDCGQFIFDPDTSQNTPVDTGGIYGVRAARSMPVTPICANLFGMPLPTFEVCGEAAALMEGVNGSPRLFYINNFLCPPTP